MRRRSFFGAAFAGIGSLASAKPPSPAAGDIPTRTLGRTGQKLSIIGLGGARFQMIPFDEGTKLVQRAYDLGINYFDMARDYAAGHNEEVYGAAIPPFRKKVFVTTKSGKRTREGAEADLNNSLRTMKTDYVDLWQMHMVNSKEIIEQALGPGGAMEAFVAAKKAGKARFIGFTGHADPAVIVQMLRSTDAFETLLMPLHAADTAYLSFEKAALPVSVERGIGQFGMKIFANAFNLRVFSVQDCLRYTLTLPVTAVTLGVTTQGQLEDNVRIAQNFKPLSAEEMDALRARAVAKKQDVTYGPALEYWKNKA
jgi:uncharacterized protein